MMENRALSASIRTASFRVVSPTMIKWLELGGQPTGHVEQLDL
jgi:hypothetical protein